MFYGEGELACIEFVFCFSENVNSLVYSLSTYYTDNYCNGSMRQISIVPTGQNKTFDNVGCYPHEHEIYEIESRHKLVEDLTCYNAFTW